MLQQAVSERRFDTIKILQELEACDLHGTASRLVLLEAGHQKPLAQRAASLAKPMIANRNINVGTERPRKLCQHCIDLLLNCTPGVQAPMASGRSPSNERCLMCQLAQDYIKSAIFDPKDIDLCRPWLSVELFKDDVTKTEHLVTRCGRQTLRHPLRQISCE
jgi:hypothetical protein